MNPPNKENTGLQLPPPLAEQASPVPEAGKNSGQAAPRAAEKASAKPERAPATQLPAVGPLSTLPTIPLPLSTIAPPNDVATTTQSAALQIDDDGDLIEKEWVNKAKQIVERTRDDPYKQSEELTVFKADYMKKRYDKTIKVSQ